MSGGAKLNWVLLALVIGILALNWVLETDPTQRNIEVLPGMVTSVAYESFTVNPVLAGGMTMQTPPSGTIPRQHLPLHYEATPEDAVRAGLELENPIERDDVEAKARGEFIFNTYCKTCHGATGEGDGPVASRGFPTPASLLAPNARNIADGKIFHVVTYGQGNMPGHASQIEPEDRWKVTLWVRHLQLEAGPVVEELIEETVEGVDEEGVDEF
jgi:mono/diheme cytochrome c family protein